MGLFVKRQATVVSPLYRMGNQKTKLVVGLGNVGKQYQATRHNAGFLAVDNIVELQGGTWAAKSRLKSFVCELQMGETRVIFAKPSTLMNLSGEAVKAVKRFYKIENESILVVHDEIDIAFGTIRVRRGGSSAGHNGIKSVSSHIGDDYYRLRIGVLNPTARKDDTAEFVLKNFSAEEQVNFAALLNETNALITEFVYSDHLSPDTRKFV